jgi:hypothetical protein
MVKKSFILLIHGLIGWGLCGALIGIGRSVTSMDNTLVIHAIAVPIIFGVISWIYFSKFHYTTPLQTAFIFLGIIVLMDGGIIAPFAEKSFAMFSSLLGTWIPFALIFGSTYLVGWLKTRGNKVALLATE